ncbi:MAG TPA: choice-of-anchor I family protein [Candidatus Limnocylindria bacterium]|nr:choice-of-anchor I family protein [Candidatus Limnocylindria bacterium]
MNSLKFYSTTLALALLMPFSACASSFRLTPIGTHVNGPPFNTSAAEIVSYDPKEERLYVVNAQGGRIDVLDIEDPTTPTKIATIDMSPYGTVVNSVAVNDGLIAVAVEAPVKTDRGHVVFFNRNLEHKKTVQVGALPDMVIFSPDGRWLLAANEGEPNTYNDFGSETNGPSIDPEGSVSIIDLKKGVSRATVRTATFTRFNHDKLDSSIRIFGPNATVAQDLEPEYITISRDSKTAWVTLQENNAIAKIDIEDAKVEKLYGLGFKDHKKRGNGLDVSDQDGGIHILNWPLRGVYMPDAISSYKVHDDTYLVMANEGDTRVYPGFSEEVRVSTLTLDAKAFPNAAELQKTNNLGRLTITKVNLDPDHDGDVDVLYSLGGRSFSIRDEKGKLVFDSGDDFEQLTALLLPLNFNASHTANTKDARSTSKGPEPEGLALGKAYGRRLAFIGFERVGGIVVYDISDPEEPRLLDYVNYRNFAEPFDFATEGDLGPEGLLFIEADDSPNGKPLLVVANEISGTTTIFQLDKH